MNNCDIITFLNKVNKYDKKLPTQVISTLSEISEDEKNKQHIQFINIEKINKQFFKLNKMNDKYNNDICTICQETIQNKEHKTCLNNCSHVFHKKCINKMIKVKKLDFKCPNCNLSYSDQLINIAIDL